jgi:hypothetical protein
VRCCLLLSALKKQTPPELSQTGFVFSSSRNYFLA